MKNLTHQMKAELKRISDLAVPESFRKNGFPGNPDRCFDGRLVPALERMGLVDCVIHKWRPQHETRDRYTVCVKITEAGREAIWWRRCARGSLLSPL